MFLTTQALFPLVTDIHSLATMQVLHLSDKFLLIAKLYGTCAASDFNYNLLYYIHNININLSNYKRPLHSLCTNVHIQLQAALL